MFDDSEDIFQKAFEDGKDIFEEVFDDRDECLNFFVDYVR